MTTPRPRKKAGGDEAKPERKKSAARPPAEGLKAKREEFKTYYGLGLSRALKSRVQRERINREGLLRVIGGDHPERPPLAVLRVRYGEVLRAATQVLLRRAQAAGIPLPPEKLLEQLRASIELETYDRLAAEARENTGVEALFLRDHGRRPTPLELTRFAETHAAARSDGRPPEAGTPALRRVSSLDGLMARIDQKQKRSSGRLQSAWAEVVGSDAAQQSLLQKIDPATGIAYFRCTNSVLSYQLQRRPGLLKALSDLLETPIKGLRSTY